MASLVILSGMQKGMAYPLGIRSNVIGRAESLPIQVLDDQVSRKHLRITFDRKSQRYYVLDLKSRNGAFLNDMRLNLEAALLEGDHLRIGQTELLYTEQDPENVELALHLFKRPGEQQKPTCTGWWDTYC